MKKITLLFTAATFISTGIFAQSANSLTLKKGQKYIVESKVSSKSSTEMQGQTMDATADISTTYSIEVKDIVSDNYTLTNTVTDVKMNVSQMGQDMTFDSEKKEDIDGEIGSNLKDYIKKPTDVVIDKSGNIIPQKTDKKADSTNMIVRQVGNYEATGYGAQLAFEPLPQNIAAGSTWSKKDSTSGVSKTTNYTVKAVNGDLATLSISGDMATDTKMESQGMEITTKTTGKFTGEEIVDTKSGVVQSNNLTIDASGNIGVMGQELPTTSKITTATTVKEM